MAFFLGAMTGREEVCPANVFDRLFRVRRRSGGSSDAYESLRHTYLLGPHSCTTMLGEHEYAYNDGVSYINITSRSEIPRKIQHKGNMETAVDNYYQ